MALTTNITGRIEFNLTSASGGTTASYRPVLNFTDALTSGTGLDTADQVWVSAATAITGSGTNAHDVAGGLTDAYGNTLTFVKVKGLFIHNLSTTAGDTLTVGGDVNGLLIFGTAAHTHTIGPNGVLFISEPSLAGKAVTAGTGDILDVTEDAGNANTYDIAIWGTSA